MEVRPMSDKHIYQTGYSDYFAKYQFDFERQKQKADKTLAVLSDYFGADVMRTLKLLDVGCSAGLMTSVYAQFFAEVVGVDIDAPAVAFANGNERGPNTRYCVSDGMSLPFASETFDVVTCSHIYEHVPDYNRLISEIRRVLRPGGVCYFVAQNRICLVEPHYFLPFLSIPPKRMAHKYMKLFGKGDFYYENLITYWGLKKLVSDFTIVDYTKKIIENPAKFHADELVSQGSLMQKIALFVLGAAYFLCPTYVWLLKK